MVQRRLTVGHQVMRVLVIEDNPQVAEAVSWLIEFLGHTVRIAYSAREALDQTRRWTPDVVVTDIGLPDIDGYRLAPLLRQEGHLEGVPIFSLSAYHDDPVRRKEAGIKAHYLKPVGLNQLREMLAA